MARTDQMSFRTWCREKWYEHTAELESYSQPVTYTAKEYFVKYKYWLKREYAHQRGNNNV
jgi:hypothetical protein